jgi:hypothetical protein
MHAPKWCEMLSVPRQNHEPVDGSGGRNRDVGKPKIVAGRSGSVSDRASDTGDGAIQPQNLVTVGT